MVTKKVIVHRGDKPDHSGVLIPYVMVPPPTRSVRYYIIGLQQKIFGRRLMFFIGQKVGYRCFLPMLCTSCMPVLKYYSGWLLRVTVLIFCLVKMTYFLLYLVLIWCVKILFKLLHIFFSVYNYFLLLFQ